MPDRIGYIEGMVCTGCELERMLRAFTVSKDDYGVFSEQITAYYCNNKLCFKYKVIVIGGRE